MKLDRPSDSPQASTNGEGNWVTDALQSANLAAQEGDHDRSAALYSELIEAFPTEASFHEMRALALMAGGRFAEAAGVAQRAVDLNPSSGRHAATAASAYLRLADYRRARRLAGEAVRLDHRRPEVLLAAARTFRECLDHARASEWVGKALDSEPGHAGAWYLKALLAADIGQSGEAESALVKTLSLNAGNSRALAGLANVLQAGLDNADLVTVLESHRSGSVTGAEPARAGYALADVYYRSGQYAEAWGMAEAANASEAEKRPFDIDAHEQAADAIVAAGSFEMDTVGEGHAQATGNPARAFIVGMPGSGLTLLEFLICRHAAGSKAAGLGMFNGMEGAQRLLESQRVVPAIAQGALAPGEEQIRKAREFYLEQASALGVSGEVLLEGNPLNCLRVPMMARMFPGARFIHLARQPLDTALACYFHDFQAGMNFSLSLEKTVRFLAAQRRLMAHWAPGLGERLLTVRYEDLVGRTDECLGGIMTFLGLDYDPSAAGWDPRSQPVPSARTWQVRAPVSDEGVGWWRQFEPQVAGAASYLQAIDLLDDELEEKA